MDSITSTGALHDIGSQQQFAPRGCTLGYPDRVFGRDSDSDSAVISEDDVSNRSGLDNLLPSLRVQPTAIEAYPGVRATTSDRLPLVGPLHDFERSALAYADLKHGRKLETYPLLPVHAGA